VNRPTLFFLHGLGLSARFWDDQIALLRDRFDCVALDLPGFGNARDASALTVEQMVECVMAAIRERPPALWMLVGHSMGGKLATLIAARVEAGEPGMAGLVGVVLLAASPPAPEPMSEEQRDEMRGWFADGPPDQATARGFVEANIAAPLPEETMRSAIADVRRSSREAWLGWLERGSREDWSSIVGTLHVPAQIVAGAEDGDLGIDAQRRLNLPHYVRGAIEIVDGAAHMLPLERPAAVAAIIIEHWSGSERVRPLGLAVERLIRSDRTSARTRGVLLGRLVPPGEAHVLGAARIGTLAALAERILPGSGDPMDLALRIDATLASGAGDGWRFATLPADDEAWRSGLDTLAEVAPDFAALPAEQRDRWLQRVADGEIGVIDTPGRLSASQMVLWFEDVCAEVARTWLSLPATMARIGYDGFANGGDGVRKQGYARLGADDLEAWQAVPAGEPI